MYLLYIYLYVKYNICIYLPTAVIEIQKLLRLTLSIILMKCCALSFFFVKHLIAVSWRSLIWLVKVLCLGREVEKWRKQKEEGSGRVSAHRDTKTQPQSRAFVWKTGSVCVLWCNIYRHHPPCSLTSGQRLNFTYHTTSAGIAKISGRFFFYFFFLVVCCVWKSEG